MKFTLLIAALIAATVQPALASEFRVDVIVFLNQATPNGSPDEASAAIGRFEANGIALGASGALQSVGVRRLPDDSFGLDQAWNRLRNAQAFVPYLRASWVQAGKSRRQAPALRLNDGVTVEILPTPERRYVSEIYSEAEPAGSIATADDQAVDGTDEIAATGTETGDELLTEVAPGSADWGVVQPEPIRIDQLDGTISLYAQRYLHLDIDLWWVQQQSGAGVETGQLLDEADARVFHIKEQRRVRLNELHYFDHPRFGVLARVTRVGD